MERDMVNHEEGGRSFFIRYSPSSVFEAPEPVVSVLLAPARNVRPPPGVVEKRKNIPFPGCACIALNLQPGEAGKADTRLVSFVCVFALKYLEYSLRQDKIAAVKRDHMIPSP